MVTLFMKTSWHRIFFIIGVFLLTPCWSWNALGHRLVAQIAYDKMTPEARRLFKQQNHGFDKADKSQSWQNAAVWLDRIQYKQLRRLKNTPRWTANALPGFYRFSGLRSDVTWLGMIHYIDLPFMDGTMRTVQKNRFNAVWAINRAMDLLKNPTTNAIDKALSLRILLHVIGDIHQPLHATTRYTPNLPQGDKGGNLVVLYNTPIAKNLHAYWDRGAGLFVYNGHASYSALRKKAKIWEARYPCDPRSVNIDPLDWAMESQRIGIDTVYKALPSNHVLDSSYQRMAKKIIEQRIVLAGCRLAAVLNTI